jgi:signal transduction histidine kinase
LTHPERIRIAQELHDGIAQDLVALSYSLDLLLSQPETPDVTRIEIRNLIFKVSKMIESVRSEIFDLRSKAKQSHNQSLQLLLEDLQSKIDLKVTIEECGLNNRVEDELLAISRELLRNTVKHSGAGGIEISIRKSENGCTYSYQDDGNGFTTFDSSGFGILGIQERCAAIGGELSVNSSENGTNYKISMHS